MLDLGDDLLRLGDELLDLGDDLLRLGDELLNLGDDLLRLGDELPDLGDELLNLGDDLSGSKDDLSGFANDVLQRPVAPISQLPVSQPPGGHQVLLALPGTTPATTTVATPYSAAAPRNTLDNPQPAAIVAPIIGAMALAAETMLVSTP